MPDWVIDATIVGMSNTELTERRPGNVLDRRLHLIERAAKGEARLRYNQKLLGEYQTLTRTRRNDVIEILFALLDSTNSVLVQKNRLSPHDSTSRKTSAAGQVTTNICWPQQLEEPIRISLSPSAITAGANQRF